MFVEFRLRLVKRRWEKHISKSKSCYFFLYQTRQQNLNEQRWLSGNEALVPGNHKAETGNCVRSSSVMRDRGAGAEGGGCLSTVDWSSGIRQEGGWVGGWLCRWDIQPEKELVSGTGTSRMPSGFAVAGEGRDEGGEGWEADCSRPALPLLSGVVPCSPFPLAALSPRCVLYVARDSSSTARYCPRWWRRNCRRASSRWAAALPPPSSFSSSPPAEAWGDTPGVRLCRHAPMVKHTYCTSNQQIYHTPAWQCQRHSCACWTEPCKHYLWPCGQQPFVILAVWCNRERRGGIGQHPHSPEKRAWKSRLY